MEDERKVNLAEECAAYCTALDDCIAFQHIKIDRKSKNIDIEISTGNRCLFALSGSTFTGHKCGDSTCLRANERYKMATFGVKNTATVIEKQNIPLEYSQKRRCPSLLSKLHCVHVKFLLCMFMVVHFNNLLIKVATKCGGHFTSERCL